MKRTQLHANLLSLEAQGKTTLEMANILNISKAYARDQLELAKLLSNTNPTGGTVTVTAPTPTVSTTTISGIAAALKQTVVNQVNSTTTPTQGQPTMNPENLKFEELNPIEIEATVPLKEEIKLVSKYNKVALPETDISKRFSPQPIKNYMLRKIDDDIAFWADKDPNTGYQFKPVGLIGESGSGKNYAVMHYATQMGLPFLIIPCDDSQILKELLGHWKAQSGTTVWCEGLLTKFLSQPSVVLFDEVNCLPSGKLFMLHELLANRMLFLNQAPADQSVVNVHPDCKIFLAMNPPEARYSGTNKLNTALGNRIVFVEVPPFKDTEILTDSSGSVDMDNKIIKFYKDVSQIIREQKLRVSISKRNIDTISKAIKKGLDIETAVCQGFINSALATATEAEKKTLINLAVVIFGASNFKNIK